MKEKILSPEREETTTMKSTERMKVRTFMYIHVLNMNELEREGICSCKTKRPLCFKQITVNDDIVEHWAVNFCDSSCQH